MGDLNGDGALDIVAGNDFGQQNVVYLNGLRRARGLPNHAPFIIVTRPISTGNANLYSTPVLLSSSTIPITYTLYDPEGDPVGRVAAEYSFDGGGQWFPAVATNTITTNLKPSSDPMHGLVARWKCVQYWLGIVFMRAGTAFGRGYRFLSAARIR